MAALALAVAIALIIAVWVATQSSRKTIVTALVLAALMSAQHAAASAGILHDWDRRPPPLFLLVSGMVILTCALAFSKLGVALSGRLSFAALIYTQAFRLPLELTMHRAAREGVMPIQMSYSGFNFDILTGLSALILGLLLAFGRAGPRAIRIWNIAGFCLLLNIVGIAIASLPLFRAFGDDRVNTWVAYPPFEWLPGVLVPAALLGHLLVWKKLNQPAAI